MCSFEKPVFLLAERSLSSLLFNASLVSEAAKSSLVKNSVNQLTKIYCVARGNSSFRLALDFTKYMATQLCNGTRESLMQNCVMQLHGRNLYDKNRLLSEKELSWGVEDLTEETILTHSQIFEVGRRLLEDFCSANAPERLLSSKVIKTLKSVLGISEGRLKMVEIPEVSSSETGKWSYMSALWGVAQKQWKGTTLKISQYLPEGMCNTVIEQVQHKLKDILFNNPLVLQMVEARRLLTATTLSIKHEAQALSLVLSKSTDQVITGFSEFWKQYYVNLFTLESMYNTLNSHFMTVPIFEGIELFSQYVWTTKPSFDLPQLMDRNFIEVDDEDFHFVEAERTYRRSVLFIGGR